MANRFDRPYGQQYVSTYTPLPFQELAGLGENISQKRQAGESEMSQLEKMISDINVSEQVLSEGSENDLGIKYRNTGYNDFKNQLLSKAKQKHAELTDQYTKGQLDINEFNRKVKDFNNEFKSDFQKLKIAEVNSAAIKEADKKYREAKHAGANPFVLNKMAEEGSRFLSDPFSNEYKGAPIGDVLDLEKTKNEYADKFKSQIISSGAGRADQFGNVTYIDKSGVTKQRIINSVESTFDQDPMLGTQTREQTNRWLRDNGYDWDTKIKLNNGQELKAGDYYYNNIKQDFINGVVAKAEQSEMKKQIRTDVIGAENREIKRMEDAVQGNPIESRTFNLSLFEQDPTGKKLLNEGTIKNNNGLLQIDKNKLLETLKEYKTYNYDKGSVATKTGEKQSFEKVKELTEFVHKIGTGLGYDKKDIKYDNFEKIINEYNAGSMMRIADEQMAGPVREVETNKLVNNWNNYDFFDVDNPTVPLKEKPLIEKQKGDKVVLNNFRNIIKNGKAEMYRDGYIQKADGEIIPIFTKPASLIDNGYHDNISDINLIYSKSDLNQIQPTRTVKSKDAEGNEVVSLMIKEDIPVSNKGTVDIFKTKDNSSDKYYTTIQFRPYDGTKPLNFYNQQDYQQFMLGNYYKTRVGNSESYEIAPKKDKFTSLSNDYQYDDTNDTNDNN